jgi:hypothetical protein
MKRLLVASYYGQEEFSKPSHQIDNCTMPDPKTQCFTTVLENGTFLITTDYQYKRLLGEEEDEEGMYVGETDEVPMEGGSKGGSEGGGGDQPYCDDDGFCYNQMPDSETYCDVPDPSNPCHDRFDVSEDTGLATCINGSLEEDPRDCVR